VVNNHEEGKSFRGKYLRKSERTGEKEGEEKSSAGGTSCKRRERKYLRKGEGIRRQCGPQGLVETIDPACWGIPAKRKGKKQKKKKGSANVKKRKPVSQSELREGKTTVIGGGEGLSDSGEKKKENRRGRDRAPKSEKTPSSPKKKGYCRRRKYMSSVG